jgi:hypothetical protein
MSVGIGYSLWLMPQNESEQGKNLGLIIQQIAQVQKTPVFPPHVTLLANLSFSEQEMRERTARLASHLNPYLIRLEELGSNGSYFQILFSAVAQSTRVVEARRQAEEIFGLNAVDYFPHLSLAYGDLTRDQVRELGRQVATHRPPIRQLGFIPTAISLWSTIEEVSEWYEVAKFPFKET